MSRSTAAHPLCPLFPHMSERKAAYILQNLPSLSSAVVWDVLVPHEGSPVDLIFISVIVTVGGNGELPLQPRRPRSSDLTAE